jgi:hypothetical protein
MTNYIPLFFVIGAAIIVLGINTPQSLAIVLPLLGLFMVILFVGR